MPGNPFEFQLPPSLAVPVGPAPMPAPATPAPVRIGGPLELVPLAQLQPQGAAPSALPPLTGPVNLSSGGGAWTGARDAQKLSLSGGTGDLRPLFAPPATPPTAQPGQVITGGRGAPGPAGPGSAPEGSPYTTQYLNDLEAYKQALMRPRPQGRMVRPPAPEPLVRLGKLQDEAGNIQEAQQRGEQTIEYRRLDNDVDLARERARMADDEATLVADREAKLKPIRDQLAQIQQDVAAGQVDPDRLWNKASDGRKAGFMIGAILSGLGQSMAGRGGQPNAAMQTLFSLMDRDNSAQVLAQQARGQKANDLAQLYKQTVDLTGSERAGVHAANLAKLDALERQFAAEREDLRAKMVVGGSKRDPFTGQPVETTMLDLRTEAALNQIRQRRAQEELQLQAQIAAATKPIGVGGGNNRAKLLRDIANVSKEQAAASNEAQKLARERGANEPNAIFVNGQRLMVDPNAPKEAAYEAQKKINMADMGLATIDSMEGRLKAAPAAGLVEKGARLIGADRVASAVADEARLLGTDQVTGLMSQLSGAGVPSETQARLYQQILAGGQGALTALGEARRILNQGKQITIQGVGVR